MNALRERLDNLPPRPGVYLFRDKDGEVVYVGKAVNLRNRVRSYFNRTTDSRFFVRLLDEVLGEIETIVTRNEKEALILENNLIKQHKPRFNVLLRDDKEFLCLRVDTAHAWPRVVPVRTREIAKDGARYYGPYSAATAIRETLRVINKHFQLRTCSDFVLEHRSRPCIQYQIRRCPGPCVFEVDKAEYAGHVRSVGLFLEGRTQELRRELEAKMQSAAEALEFERAAVYRDQLEAVKHCLEKQHIVSPSLADQDVIGFYREGDRVEIQVLCVRGGRLSDAQSHSFRRMEFPDEEILSSFVGLYYDRDGELPREVIVPRSLDDMETLSEWLEERAGHKVEVLAPKRGDRVRLVELANQNAQNAFQQKRRHEESLSESLVRLQRRLRLRRLPERIECFDMAHFQGGAAVGSMVALIGGLPDKARYRHYRIKSAQTNDDFAMMREVLMRRYRRALEDGELPDLVVIDGGKGQLGVAMQVFADLGIEDVDLISLAKSKPVGEERPAGRIERSPERVFLPGQKNAVVLRQNSAELFVLTRLRDEAHRFANVLHDKLRRRRSLWSALEGVAGVGQKRHRALLRQFGSLKRLEAASEAEIAAVDGMNASAAKAVYALLHAAPSDDVANGEREPSDESDEPLTDDAFADFED
jgi:excinuclease ABC subunit C